MRDNTCPVGELVTPGLVCVDECAASSLLFENNAHKACLCPEATPMWEIAPGTTDGMCVA